MIGRRSGLLVIDEAHCVSDWGHDFRPDYRRIVRVLDLLPTGVPVVCCTATANNRVVEDITDQLGADFAPLRGPMARSGLRLHVLDKPSQAERLAWLAGVVEEMPGTGIVYCLTVKDTERVALWLRLRGIAAAAYSGKSANEDRLAVERRLLANDVKVVVATSALGAKERAPATNRCKSEERFHCRTPKKSGHCSTTTAASMNTPTGIPAQATNTDPDHDPRHHRHR